MIRKVKALARTDFLRVELEGIRAQGLFRPLRALSGPQGPRAVIDGREVINLSSNNYLGLTNHPKLVEATIEATRKLGAGTGAVRTIIGTMDLHLELERRLARFKKTEAALVFQSGFTCNLGVIPVLVGEGDFIISDELNHASIIDGCRLSRAKIIRYAHRDLTDLRKVLTSTAGIGRKLIITDGVFSMDGDIAPLPGIVSLAAEFDALVYVDDAHGSGVLGQNGRGSVNHFRLDGQVEVQVGTLSKAIGVLGGYVAGSRDLIDLLIHKGRPFLFSTSHPPGVTAACLAALDILESEPDLIQKLWAHARFFREGLTKLGFDTGVSETPIIPVMVGEGTRAMKFSDRLFEAGVSAQGISFPTVPAERSRVRAIVTAAHARADLEEALEAFGRAGRELGII